MSEKLPLPASVSALIRQRRSIFPPVYTDEPIEKHIIEEILENANWAPTHRRTEPWRFRVFRGQARSLLADFLAEWYKSHTPAADFSEVRYKKMQVNPLRSDTIIAICLQRDPEERVPEWEEIAAVACAVQNMWLSCTAYGLGSYWSTPPAAQDAATLLALEPGQRCLGFFYIGRYDLPPAAGERKPLADKTIWFGE